MKKLKQKLEVLAVYDGFKAPPKGCINPAWINKAEKRHFLSGELKKYSLSYNWLIPVAKKVYNELMSVYLIPGNNTTGIADIFVPLVGAPFKDISELFDVTYNAIAFLNGLKENP